jgi:hypothetical protein
MVASGDLNHVLESERRNAVLSWLLLAFVAVTAVESFLDGDLLWVVFPAVVLALALVPPALYRKPTVMLPWEVLALCSLPVGGRALATTVLTTNLATYLSVAALALVVAVELDVFTLVRMPPWFAVLFVVLATMATAGVWALVQWTADLSLGTTFLYPEPLDRPTWVARGGLADALLWTAAVVLSQASVPVPEAVEATAHDELMWDFVAATVAGVAAGAVFEFYFRRRTRGERRLPVAVRDAVEDDPAVENPRGDDAAP